MDLKKIVETVCAINDPSTSNADRISGTKAIEDLKEGYPDVLAKVGFELIGLKDNLLSHVGWTFIEDLLRYKWNSISVDFKVLLRNKILSYLEIGPIQPTIECTARSVVAMMEHEWPQNWPELFPQLEKMSSMSYLHCCTSFAIFRRVVENVITLASVSSAQRRKDMNNTIIHYLPDMLRISFERLEACQNLSINSEISLILKYVISFLAEICEWAPSACIDPVANQLVRLVVVHLNTAELNVYELAARCLAALSIRKKEKTENIVTAFFQSEVISAILTTTSQAAEVAHSNESHYQYLKALCDLLISLGNNLAKVWSEKNPPQNFEVYLSAINAFFHHPSLYLKVESIEVFILLFQSSLSTDVSFQKIMTSVLQHVPEALIKQGYPSDKKESAARHYSQMDFDDDAEWSFSFIKIREKIRVLVKFSLSSHLTQLLSIFNEWIFKKIMISPQSLNAESWDAMQKYSKMVIQTTLEGKYTEDQQIISQLFEWSDQLLRSLSNITDWNVASEILSIHSAFIYLFENKNEHIVNYVSILKHSLISSKCHKPLNRHCISQILKMVTLFPNFFKANINLMVSLCSEVQSHISEMQMAQLIQVLAALSNLVDDPAVKLELLRYSVSNAAEYLVSVIGTMNSLQEFIVFNGFHLPPPEDSENSTRDDIQRRKKLRCNLFALEGILMQVEKNSPMKEVITSIHPAIFKLARYALEINCPHSVQLMHESYKNISKLINSEKQQIYALINDGVEQQVSKTLSDVRDPHDIIRQYLNCLSDHCVNIISMASAKFGEGLYNDSKFEENLREIVMDYSSIEIFRLKNWIKKGWKNLIYNCPVDRRSTVAVLFTQVAQHLQNYLSQIWNQLATIDYDASEITKEELFNEHLACAITREYITLLRIFYLGQETSVNIDEKGSINLGELGSWLIQQQVALAPVLFTCFSILTWRDTASALRVIPLCRIFVDRLSSSYDDEVAVAMLFSGIQSLQIHGSDEVAGPSLLGLVFHIYISLRKFSNSFPGVLQQLPDATLQDIEVFDTKIQKLITGEESMQEKQKREMLKKLLRGVISLTASELHKRPVFLRPLPKLEKKPKEEVSPDYLAVAEIFSS